MPELSHDLYDPLPPPQPDRRDPFGRADRRARRRHVGTWHGWRRWLDAFRDLLAWVCFEAHIEPLEVWTGINGLLWGLWVLNPWVDIFSTATGYRTMAAVPEWAWGVAATLASGVQLCGRLRGQPTLQRVGARALAALWMFAAGALVWENWRWPATVTYPMLAIASLLVSYRSESYPKRRAEAPLVPSVPSQPHEGAHVSRA